MKKTILVLLAAMLLLTACSERANTPADTDAPAVTAPAAGTVDSPETTVPSVTEEEKEKFQWSKPTGGEDIEVISGAENLNIRVLHTESDWHGEFRYDDRYVLVISCDRMRDKDGNLVLDEQDGILSDNIRLRVLDVTRGEFSDDIPFAGTDVPHSISYFDGGCWLYSSSAAWRVCITSGKIDIIPVRLVSVENLGRQYSSPDGAWVAYTEESTLFSEPESTRKLLLRAADGTLTVIAEDKRDSNAQTDRYYTPIGFLDDTHLAYFVMGWESSVGWGIYDIAAGTHLTGEGTVQGVYNGEIYLTDGNIYEPSVIRSVDAFGNVTTHAEKGKTDLPLFEGNHGWGYRTVTMTKGLWIMMPYDQVNDVRTFVFDAEAKTLLCEIAHAPDGGSDFWYTDGKTLTFVRE